MFRKTILLAAAVLVLEAGGAEGRIAETGNRSDPKLTAEQVKARQAAEQEKAKKLAELSIKRTELIRKIHEVRKELLKNNPKLRRMHQQLMKQTRELALELEANREMRKLNDNLTEVERQLEREMKK